MLARTLYFGNAAYLSTKNEQIVVFSKDETGSSFEKVMPIEDVGIVILDHYQITITQSLISKFLESNVALITCDDTHHPTGLMLNLEGNTLQQQKHRIQIEASAPLKKQLWQQTVSAKIRNQAKVLQLFHLENAYLINLSENVKSGDSGNEEAKAAVFYWKKLFGDIDGFKRERYGPPPNNLLNYGYAILRAIVARALVGSGLFPSFGIFHKNQYNAYCLADDIMEPYRPFIDIEVFQIIRNNDAFLELSPEMKKQLLSIPVRDVLINGRKTPLMIAVTRTTASLVKCLEGVNRKLLYPEMCW